MSYLASGYLVGAARGLGDVPIVPVTVPLISQIAPPVTAVEETPYTPGVFIVPRPRAASLGGGASSGLEALLPWLGAAAAVVTIASFASRRRR